MKKGFVILLICVFLISMASAAEIKVKNYSIPKSISEGDTLTGTVNLSLKDVKANSIVRSNFGGNITLLELLNENDLYENDGYSCNHVGCVDDYKVGDMISSVQLNGSTKYVGFKITGAVDEIKDLNLKMENSLTGAGSCSEQDLRISFLRETNLVPSASFDLSVDCSSVNYGCFDKNLSSSDYDLATITSNLYCSQINLTGGFGYKIGANITNATNGKQGTLSMQISDEDGVKVGECILPNATLNTQDLDCFVNKTLAKTGPYTICVRNNNYNSGSGPNFKIKLEEKGKKCTSEGRDYEIFAKRVAYSPHYLQTVNKTTYNGLTSEVENYLTAQYNLNCSGYCVVPFMFKGISQTISFDNPLIYYTRVGPDAPQIPSESLYSLTKDDSLLNMNMVNIKLDYAGFVADKATLSKFDLYIGDEKIFSQNIDVTESLDFSLIPSFVPVGIKTTLVIVTSKNITSSKWTISNGTAISSSGDSIEYTFHETGEYTIVVEATDSGGIKSSKEFTISVGDASDSANRLYTEKKGYLTNVSKRLSTYPTSVSNQIKKVLDFDNVQSQINSIGNELNISVTDQDYIRVIERLLTINFPDDLTIDNTGQLSLLPVDETSDLSYIQSLSSSTQEYNRESLTAAINSWNIENYRVKMDSEVYYATFNEDNVPLTTRVKINLEPLKGNEEVYLIIDYPLDSSSFVSSTTQLQSLAGESFSYAKISGRTDVEFFLPNEVLVTSIPVYLSPSIEKLSLGTSFGVDDVIMDPKFKTMWFAFYIGVIIIIFIVIYAVLYEWYKKNYEKSLFNTKDDLYNLINFIYNSRMGGNRDNEIKKNLAQAGWKGEQLRYSFKKIDGKRTGMFEIPIFKNRENKIVKQELERRQGRPIDARFIKMQNNEVA